MAFCNQCGQPLADGSKFCNKCGAPIENKQGSDEISLDVEISIQVVLKDESSGSTDVEVYLPHLSKTVAVKVPNNISIGKSLRLRGLGHTSHNGEKGDAYIRIVQINYDNTTSETQEPKRKVRYEGEVRICPQCKAAINSFVSVCPCCGHEIRGSKAVSSVMELARKLEDAKSEEQRASLIRNFPVPNTKEDILEFMIMASSNIDARRDNTTTDAWQAKLEQSYQKATLLLEGEDLQKVNLLYEDANKIIRASNMVRRTKQTGKILGNGFSAIFEALSKLLKITPRFLEPFARNILSVLSIFAYLKAIQMDRAGENGVGYELLGGILSLLSASLLMRKQANFLDYAIVFACGLSSFYLENLLRNGAFLQLMGAMTLLIIIVCFIRQKTEEE